MSSNPYNKSIYGYTGLYRRPFSNQRIYGDTIYAITDETHQEIHMIMLSPGFYKDAYQILACPTYQDIHIYLPVLDISNISDIFGLVMDLKKTKKSVMWHYPQKYRTTNPKNVLFEMCQYDKMTFTSNHITNLIITFEDAGYTDVPDLIYDIKVCNGSKGDIFTIYPQASKAEARMSDRLYKMIHMPYNGLYYGGMTAKEIVAERRAYGQFITPNNFKCREEFLEVMNDTIFHNCYDRCIS